MIFLDIEMMGITNLLEKKNKNTLAFEEVVYVFNKLLNLFQQLNVSTEVVEKNMMWIVVN